MDPKIDKNAYFPRSVFGIVFLIVFCSFFDARPPQNDALACTRASFSCFSKVAKIIKTSRKSAPKVITFRSKIEEKRSRKSTRKTSTFLIDFGSVLGSILAPKTFNKDFKNRSLFTPPGTPNPKDILRIWSHFLIDF